MPFTTSHLNSVTEKKKRDLFDKLISKCWGTYFSPPALSPESDPDNDLFDPYEDDDEPARAMPDFFDPVDDTNQLIDQQPAYNILIHSEINLPQCGRLQSAKVLRQFLDPSGRSVGAYHKNPILNTLVYDVEFPDGEVKEYSAKIMSENLLAQFNDEGFTLTVFDIILDHTKDVSAIQKKDFYFRTRSGTRRMRKTTCGWKFLVIWKDGSKTWVSLADMKESHPVEISKYSKSRGINKEPAFSCWVPYTLRKRDIIISAVNSRVYKTTHKYGVEIPNSIKISRDLDLKNGNYLWITAIKKETSNFGIAFEILNENKTAPVGWSNESGHLIYDLKIDYTRKARWVLDGHRSADPDGSNYAGVVSRDSFFLFFESGLQL